MATATVARTLTRAIPRSSASATSSIRLAARPSRSNAAKQFFQQSSRRHYSSEPTPPKSNNSAILGGVAAIALFAGGYYYYGSQGKTPEVHLKQGSAGQSAGLFKPTPEDYQKVYNAVAKALWEKDDYDDGSYGPVLLRLAWHASGTYDAATGTGGSNGATMRFAPEGDHGANAGLKNARDFLEPIKRELSSFQSGQILMDILISADRAISMDLLLRPVDVGWCLCHSRNARTRHPLATGPTRQRRLVLHPGRPPA